VHSRLSRAIAAALVALTCGVTEMSAQSLERPNWLVTLESCSGEGEQRKCQTVCNGAVIRVANGEVWFASAAHCKDFSQMRLAGHAEYWSALKAYRHFDNQLDLAVYGVQAKFPGASEMEPSTDWKPAFAWSALLGLSRDVVKKVDCTAGYCVQKKSNVAPTPRPFKPGDSGGPVVDQNDRLVGVLKARTDEGNVAFCAPTGRAFDLVTRAGPDTGITMVDNMGLFPNRAVASVEDVLSARTQDVLEILRATRALSDWTHLSPSQKTTKIRMTPGLRSGDDARIDFLIASGLLSQR
jgi:hypothetical protein